MKISSGRRSKTDSNFSSIDFIYRCRNRETPSKFRDASRPKIQIRVMQNWRIQHREGPDPHPWCPCNRRHPPPSAELRRSDADGRFPAILRITNCNCYCQCEAAVFLISYRTRFRSMDCAHQNYRIIILKNNFSLKKKKVKIIKNIVDYRVGFNYVKLSNISF